MGHAVISRRAGRDGLEAERCLFYSGSGYLTWERILENSERQMLEMGAARLRHMYRYCSGVSCRHWTILRYFGQNLDKENCEACDVCLSEAQRVPDALVVAQSQSGSGSAFAASTQPTAKEAEGVRRGPASQAKITPASRLRGCRKSRRTSPLPGCCLWLPG
jgi:superfamily II DNA helicase RecQ